MQVYHLLSSNSSQSKSSEEVSYFEVKSYQLLAAFINLVALVVCRITIHSYCVKVHNFHPVRFLYLEIPPRKRHHKSMLLDLCMNPQQN